MQEAGPGEVTTIGAGCERITTCGGPTWQGAAGCIWQVRTSVMVLPQGMPGARPNGRPLGGLDPFKLAYSGTGNV
jgi:hypothetical protein